MHAASGPPAATSADARAAELRALNERRRASQTSQLVPLLYAPLLPLIRIGLRGQPPLLRDAAFGAALCVALSHAGYVMFSDSSV